MGKKNQNSENKERLQGGQSDEKKNLTGAEEETPGVRSGGGDVEGHLENAGSRCRFQVVSKQESVSAGGMPVWNVLLKPEPERRDANMRKISGVNDSFWASTPQGEIALLAINSDVAHDLHVGSVYEVSFNICAPEEGAE